MPEIKYKAYKFRMYPSNEQADKLNQFIGCSRFIYNHLLEDKKKYYSETKKNLKREVSYYKNIEEFSFLKDVDSLALANAKMNLDKAYKNFFEKRSKEPTFHRKGKNDSYTTNNVNNSIKINDNKIKLPKLDFIKFKQSKRIEEGTIKNCTVSKKAGKFFISILIEIEPVNIEIITKEKIDINKICGFDYSSPMFYVDSNGNSPTIPHFFEESQKKLAIEQEKLSRKQKHSKNYYKQLLKVQKVHEHIANQRKDFLHKLSNQITNDYDMIVFEDLDLRAISNKEHKDSNTGNKLKLGKRTLDNGFGMFRTFCEYKALNKGKVFIKVNKYYPSTKTCYHCKEINNDITLSTKEWDCPNCNNHNLRDYNAALNIKDEGYRIYMNQ